MITNKNKRDIWKYLQLILTTIIDMLSIHVAKKVFSSTISNEKLLTSFGLFFICNIYLNFYIISDRLMFYVGLLVPMVPFILLLGKKSIYCFPIFLIITLFKVCITHTIHRKLPTIYYIGSDSGYKKCIARLVYNAVYVKASTFNKNKLANKSILFESSELCFNKTKNIDVKFSKVSCEGGDPIKQLLISNALYNKKSESLSVRSKKSATLIIFGNDINIINSMIKRAVGIYDNLVLILNNTQSTSLVSNQDKFESKIWTLGPADLPRKLHEIEKHLNLLKAGGVHYVDAFKVNRRNFCDYLHLHTILMPIIVQSCNEILGCSYFGKSKTDCVVNELKLCLFLPFTNILSPMPVESIASLRFNNIYLSRKFSYITSNDFANRIMSVLSTGNLQNKSFIMGSNKIMNASEVVKFNHIIDPDISSNQYFSTEYESIYTRVNYQGEKLVSEIPIRAKQNNNNPLDYVSSSANKPIDLIINDIRQYMHGY